MEATLNALGEVLLQAIPTFFLVLLLHVYLRRVFFNPLAKVLATRDEATEGARRKAREALERAEAHATSYEQSLRAVKNELYAEQEQARMRWREDQSEQLASFKARADASVAEARAKLAAQVSEAKISLGADTQSLADQITESLLRRSVA
jgi:F-type H+-transporting ATPase subunit b